MEGDVSAQRSGSRRLWPWPPPHPRHRSPPAVLGDAKDPTAAARRDHCSQLLANCGRGWAAKRHSLCFQSWRHACADCPTARLYQAQPLSSEADKESPISIRAVPDWLKFKHSALPPW